MKTIIAGGRDITDYGLVCEAVKASGIEITEVVSGCARGVDRLGERWAGKNGVHVESFPAQWTKFGKAAGPLRNAEMAAYADALIAIWDGQSKGTKDMIEQAEKCGLHVFVMYIND